MNALSLTGTSNRPVECMSEVPAISPLRHRFFLEIARRELTSHFHTVRLLRESFHDYSDCRVVFTNHPSWWDPLLLLLLADRFFPAQKSFGPIDAHSLRRYRIFRRLGFFGIDPQTRAGAAKFLRVSRELLADSENMLWLTPEGTFRDERARPVTFERGLGHLAAIVPPTKFLPVAIEYDFWNEKRPEALVAFGKPVTNENPTDADLLTQRFARALERTQDVLASAAQRREPAEWETLWRGHVGTFPLYDLWRRAVSVVRGERFSAGHEET